MRDDDPLEILLVEDDPDDLELTLHALRSNGVANRIDVARDGVEALDRLLGEGSAVPPPRVVLLDLKLPKVGGLEVLRRIKAEPRTRTIPVVVLTSSKEDRDLVESYRLGVNSYVRKPINFEEFAASVRQIGLYWLLLNQAPPASTTVR
jgi:two-component system response regulator